MIFKERKSVFHWLLVILFLSTLLTLVLIAGLDGPECMPRPFETKFFPLPAETQTKNVSLPVETKNVSLPVETKHSSLPTETKHSSWLHYREHWNGEILLQTNTDKNEIVFTDEYQIRMISKGLHPLCMEHERYYKRVDRMEKYCSAFPSAYQGVYGFGKGPNDILFSDKTKLLHCIVPKVSSATWTLVFINLLEFNLSDYSRPNDISVLVREYSKKDMISLIYNKTDEILVAKRFQTYTKFLVTRNPFERILSAYLNKFHANNIPYENRDGPKIIIASYLSHLTKEFIETVQNDLRIGKSNSGLEPSVIKQIQRLDAGGGNYKITFGEFLNFIIKSAAETGRGALDYHWAPITIVCNPCTVRYDFIVKFESIYEDSQVLLNYVQTNVTNNKVQFPKADHVVTKDRCNEAFLDIPKEVRNKLYEIYKEDFILFDYKYNGENPNNKFC